MEEDTAWRRILPGGGYFIEEDIYILWKRIFYRRGYFIEEDIL
jgi:hypothetical protein